jgi:hypothetical protein
VPIGDAYSDAATYRAVIDKTDTGEDAEILVDLTAVSRWLEQELGTFFTRDAADVARDIIVPRTGPSLLLDAPLSAAPTSVQVDTNNDGVVDTTYAATDYRLLPLNADKGPEPRPYDELLIVEDWSTRPQWQEGQLVRVTGRWGWPAVPEAIKRACIHLTAILRLETPRVQTQITDIGQVVQTSREARGIIADLYRRYRAYGGARA